MSFSTNGVGNVTPVQHRLRNLFLGGRDGVADPFVVALYPFDGNVKDYSGNRNGALVAGGFNVQNPFGSGTIQSLTGNLAVDSAVANFTPFVLASAQQAYTIDFWFRLLGNGVMTTAPAQDSGGSYSFSLPAAGGITFTTGISGSQSYPAAVTNDGLWHFCSLSRDAGPTGTIFQAIDGVLLGSLSPASLQLSIAQQLFWRRAAGAATNDANISNFRMSRGINRYPLASFPYAVPTAPFSTR